MKSMLIAAIAGLTLCFAGDFTSEAEARWRRGHRHYHRHHHGWNRGHSHRYHRHHGHYQHRHYYTPRSHYYYTPRSYYYPRYGYGWNGGSVWFRF